MCVSYARTDVARSLGTKMQPYVGQDAILLQTTTNVLQLLLLLVFLCAAVPVL
jgi:hypothetical protein